jgi:hypothetical protein
MLRTILNRLRNTSSTTNTIPTANTQNIPLKTQFEQLSHLKLSDTQKIAWYSLSKHSKQSIISSLSNSSTTTTTTLQTREIDFFSYLLTDNLNNKRDFAATTQKILENSELKHHILQNPKKWQDYSEELKHILNIKDNNSTLKFKLDYVDIFLDAMSNQNHNQVKQITEALSSSRTDALVLSLIKNNLELCLNAHPINLQRVINGVASAGLNELVHTQPELVLTSAESPVLNIMGDAHARQNTELIYFINLDLEAALKMGTAEWEYTASAIRNASGPIVEHIMDSSTNWYTLNLEQMRAEIGDYHEPASLSVTLPRTSNRNLLSNYNFNNSSFRRNARIRPQSLVRSAEFHTPFENTPTPRHATTLTANTTKTLNLNSSATSKHYNNTPIKLPALFTRANHHCNFIKITEAIINKMTKNHPKYAELQAAIHKLQPENDGKFYVNEDIWNIIQADVNELLEKHFDDALNEKTADGKVYYKHIVTVIHDENGNELRQRQQFNEVRDNNGAEHLTKEEFKKSLDAVIDTTIIDYVEIKKENYAITLPKIEKADDKKSA